MKKKNIFLILITYHTNKMYFLLNTIEESRQIMYYIKSISNVNDAIKEFYKNIQNLIDCHMEQLIIYFKNKYNIELN